MKTNALYSFEQKLMYFEDDIELIDVLRAGVLGGDLTNKSSATLLKHVDPVTHKHLARRRNSDGSRRNTINHLRSSVYSSYIKDVYEEVTEYLKAILRQASQNGFNSGRLIGEHSFKMEAKTVLELGNWDAVCKLVSESVFQNLEAEKSTLNLFKKMASKLALNIDQKLIDTALPYLEIRHFLVHADGKLSQEYIAKHPHVKEQGGIVALDYPSNFRHKRFVKALIAAFDQEVVAKIFWRQPTCGRIEFYAHCPFWMKKFKFAAGVTLYCNIFSASPRSA